MPGLVALFSKYDVWNLGNFLNRNMFSKQKFRFFFVEKFLPEKKQQHFLKNQDFRFFENYFRKKFMKISTNFLKNIFSKNRKLLIFHFFQKYFFGQFFFDFVFRAKIFRTKKYFWENFRKHISIQKIPKNPKITLRKSCDEAWHAIHQG